VELRGSKALVTGASSGIGRSIARELARRGSHVAIVARRRDLLDELATEIATAGDPTPLVVAADLSERGAAKRVAEQVMEALGQVDVLVNNAGLGLGARQDVVGDDDAARMVFEVNVWSPVALTRELAPGMKRTGGAIVNVTSTSQVMTWPFMGYYSATKAAYASFTETLRLEMKRTPVHVLEIIPGPVDTAVQGETREVPGLRRALESMPLGDPDALARRVVAALRRGRARRLVYPRVNWLSYVVPGLTRAVVAVQVWRFRDEIDVADSRVIRSGSFGDPVAVAAREAWVRRD
jgi:short-subunit dehydrogenase